MFSYELKQASSLNILHENFVIYLQESEKSIINVTNL